MGALFLGELYRLRWSYRLLLLGSGGVLAFCFNVVRTFALTWQASSDGIAAIEKWHDTVGLTIFLLCFACLWFLAWLFKLKSRTQTGRDAFRGVAERPEPIGTSPCLAPVALRRFLLLVGCYSLCLVVFTELWYRFHEANQTDPRQWTAVLPVTRAGFQNVELLPREIKSLKYDHALSGKWREENGTEWTAYFFRWNPKSMESVIRARGHRPDVCLPAAGFRQVLSSRLAYFQAGSFKVPFQEFSYDADGRRLYVFFCLWQDGDDEQKGMRSVSTSDRLQLALDGRRRIGQQTLELILTGCDNLETAEKQVRQRLPELIHAEAPAAFRRSGDFPFSILDCGSVALRLCV